MERSRRFGFWLSFVLLLSIGAAVLAQTEVSKNTGFVQDNIIFSKEPFFEGEAIKIYSILFNTTNNDITGKIEFYDNGVSLGRTDFSIPRTALVRDASINWVATGGRHTISAKIIETRVALADGKQEAITLTDREAVGSERFIDSDSDRDGLGDRDDTDDDNDGIPDLEERKTGTNPFKQDTDDDKITDPNDPQPIVPALIEQKLAVATSTETATTKNSNGVDRTTSSVEPILAAAGSVLSSANSFLDRQAVKLEEKKEVLQQTAGGDASVSGRRTNPLTANVNLQGRSKLKMFSWEGAKVAFLTVFVFLMKHKWLFYSLVIIIGFFIGRSLVRSLS